MRSEEASSLFARILLFGVHRLSRASPIFLKRCHAVEHDGRKHIFSFIMWGKLDDPIQGTVSTNWP